MKKLLLAIPFLMTACTININEASAEDECITYTATIVKMKNHDGNIEEYSVGSTEYELAKAMEYTPIDTTIYTNEVCDD